jgi:DNA polymerase-3 subunit epsilon
VTHDVLFGEGFEGAHDALADARVGSRCFFALKQQGII